MHFELKRARSNSVNFCLWNFWILWIFGFELSYYPTLGSSC